MIRLLLVLLLAASAGAAGADPVAPPRPPPPQDCRVCHQMIFAQWDGSAHARSAINPRFRQALDNWVHQGHKAADCLACHAPQSILARGLDDIPPARSGGIEEGVTCRSCHESETGAMVGPYGSRNSPHPVEKEKHFKTVRACVSCHGQPWGPCQKQVQSLDRSVLRARVSCQSCHMPVRDAPAADLINVELPVRKIADHRFPGAYDITMLGSAVKISAEVVGDQVVVRLTNVGSGHSVPASPWRKLIARVQGFDEIGRMVEEKRDGFFHERDNRLEPRKPRVINVGRKGSISRLRVRLYYMYEPEQPLSMGRLIEDKEITL